MKSTQLKRRLFKGLSTAILSTSMLGAFAPIASAAPDNPSSIIAVSASGDRVNVNATFSSIQGNLILPTFDVSQIPMSISLGETGGPLTATVKELPVNTSTMPFSDGIVSFTSNSNDFIINSDGTFTATRPGVYTVTLSVTPDAAEIEAINTELGTNLSTTELAANGINSQIQITVTEPTFPVFRVYNPNSGQHLYTSGEYEKNYLVNLGWRDEGIGWQSPFAEGNQPVYRVYNPNAGGHHYTMSRYEVDHLVNLGWRDEGVAFYSSQSTDRPVFRVYNPNSTGPTSHHYTESAYERDFLVRLGWQDEGIGWYSGITT